MTLKYMTKRPSRFMYYDKVIDAVFEIMDLKFRAEAIRIVDEKHELVKFCLDVSEMSNEQPLQASILAKVIINSMEVA